jgi:Spy/CpxP family protein refolding chaperone
MKIVRLTTLLSSAIALTSMAYPAFAQEASDGAEPYELTAMATSPEDMPMDAAPLEGAPIESGPITAALHEGGPRGGGSCSSLLSTFSDDQLEKLHGLKNQMLDALGPKITAIKSKERKLKDLLLQNNVDAAQVKSLQGEINGLKDDIGNIKADNLIAMSNVLTVDQKKQIREAVYKRSLPSVPGLGHPHHHFGGFHHGH